MENNWINIKEKQPHVYDFVLVCADNKGCGEPKPITIARHNGNEWEFLDKQPLISTYGAYMDIEYPIDKDDITHWMKLPSPPIKCEYHSFTWMPKDSRMCIKCGFYETDYKK